MSIATLRRTDVVGRQTLALSFSRFVTIILATRVVHYRHQRTVLYQRTPAYQILQYVLISNQYLVTGVTLRHRYVYRKGDMYSTLRSSLYEYFRTEVRDTGHTVLYSTSDNSSDLLTYRMIRAIRL